VRMSRACRVQQSCPPVQKSAESLGTVGFDERRFAIKWLSNVLYYSVFRKEEEEEDSSKIYVGGRYAVGRTYVPTYMPTL